MLQKEHRSCMAISAAMVGFFALTVSASAFVGLSDEDYEYLKAQHIERTDAPILNLSPKERQRVHNLINDPETDGDQIVARASLTFLFRATPWSLGPRRVRQAPCSTVSRELIVAYLHPQQSDWHPPQIPRRQPGQPTASAHHATSAAVRRSSSMPARSASRRREVRHHHGRRGVARHPPGPSIR